MTPIPLRPGWLSAPRLESPRNLLHGLPAKPLFSPQNTACGDSRICWCFESSRRSGFSWWPSRTRANARLLAQPRVRLSRTRGGQPAGSRRRAGRSTRGRSPAGSSRHGRPDTDGATPRSGSRRPATATLADPTGPAAPHQADRGDPLEVYPGDRHWFHSWGQVSVLRHLPPGLIRWSEGKFVRKRRTSRVSSGNRSTAACAPIRKSGSGTTFRPPTRR